MAGGKEGGASWWGAGEALRPPLSVVLRSGPHDDRSISSLVCLVVSRQPSSLSPNLMGHPFGRLFTLDVPDCIPQFHCEILFRERLRPNHACTLSDLVLPRGTVEDGESGSGEQKEEEKKKCVLCYNASMRHLDCYSWSWPCLPSPPCLICKGRSAVRSLAAHEQRNHIFLRARNLALSLSVSSVNRGQR